MPDGITLTKPQLEALLREWNEHPETREVHIESRNGSTVRAVLDAGWGTLRLIVNRNGRVSQEGGL